MLKRYWKAMRRIAVFEGPEGTPEIESTAPGEGKWAWLGAWGETLEGGNRREPACNIGGSQAYRIRGLPGLPG